ncbi:MAG: dTDP-4-dehydrorhamnose reductase [Actinomycetota bacterium]|nr:dTDP-4-dehydrorhamnose reductase [Actinomycetota bacterium]
MAKFSCVGESGYYYYVMRILLTGSEGQLGYDFQYVCGSRHEVVAHDIDLDITDGKRVLERAKEVRPDIIVNAAAYTDVDGAESNEILAYRVNALGAYNLASACLELDIPLLHISTDFVFSGESDVPYTEFDSPAPRGVYAKSKYAGECFVRMLLRKHFIVRTSWLFGVAGKNFVRTMLKAGNNNKEINVVNDQRGSPTYSRDLALKLFEIIEKGIFGTYHVSNTGSCTWFEFAKQIFEIAGVDIIVNPITTDEFKSPAPRPAFSVMRGLSLEMWGFKPLRHYRDALCDFILRDLPSYKGSEK